MAEEASIGDVLNSLDETRSQLSNELHEHHESQKKQLSNQMEQIIKLHEERHHPATTPSGHEVMKRGSAFFRRVDGTWDKIWSSLGVVILIALGYGIIVMVNISETKVQAVVSP